jgi:hypothetical protein
MRFAIKNSCLMRLKSVTPTFKHKIGRASFGDLTTLNWRSLFLNPLRVGVVSFFIRYL